MSEACHGEAMAAFELDSVARGCMLVDAALKHAPALVMASRPLSHGNHLVVIAGGVAEVAEAYQVGCRVGGARLLRHAWWAAPAAPLWQMATTPRVMAAGQPGFALAVACLEFRSVVAALVAADLASKASEVEIAAWQLGQDQAGRAFFLMQGELAAVEAAVDVVQAECADAVWDLAVIAQPAETLNGRLLW